MSRSIPRVPSALTVLVATAVLGTGIAAAADRGVQATFNQPLPVVHKAAVDALASIGATIGNNEPTAVDGKRPGKGGETVAVQLADIGDGKVLVDVRTSKATGSQKSWDQPVISAMTKTLAALPPAPPAAAPAATPAAEPTAAAGEAAPAEPTNEAAPEPAASEPASDPKP